MSETLNTYLDLLKDLARIRKLNKGDESEKEDTLLIQMDSVWFDLTDDERAEVQALPSKSIIKDQIAVSKKTLKMMDAAMVNFAKRINSEPINLKKVRRVVKKLDS